MFTVQSSSGECAFNLSAVMRNGAEATAATAAGGSSSSNNNHNNNNNNNNNNQAYSAIYEGVFGDLNCAFFCNKEPARWTTGGP